MGNLKKLPLNALIMLCIELDQENELIDTAENMEAPTDQLNAEGKYLRTCLNEAGYKTKEDIYLIEETLKSILIKL